MYKPNNEYLLVPWLGFQLNEKEQQKYDGRKGGEDEETLDTSGRLLLLSSNQI